MNEYPKLILNQNRTYDILLESGKAEIEDKEILKEILDECFANPNENIETWVVIDLPLSTINKLSSDSTTTGT